MIARSYEEIISNQPQHTSVSQTITVSDMAEQYQNQDIRSSFATLSSQYFQYRKIRGDGNCFVRAVGFNYLCRNKPVVYEEAYKNIEKLRLNRIKGLQEQFHKRLDQKKNIYYKGRYFRVFQMNYLYYFERLWKENFVPKVSKNKENYQNALADFMNQYQFGDLMIVLYFRALCISYFDQHREEYQIFYEDKQQFAKIQNNLKTFGQEGQGFVVKCMADALSCGLVISQIDSNNGSNTYTVHPQVKSQKVEDVHLLYKDGHYDILAEPRHQEENTIIKEKKIKIKQQQPPIDLSFKKKLDLHNSLKQLKNKYLQLQQKQERLNLCKKRMIEELHSVPVQPQLKKTAFTSMKKENNKQDEKIEHNDSTNCQKCIQLKKRGIQSCFACSMNGLMMLVIVMPK